MSIVKFKTMLTLFKLGIFYKNIAMFGSVVQNVLCLLLRKLLGFKETESTFRLKILV